MELVPIVELTLSIFTGLLLLVLIISYISSKLKNKDSESGFEAVSQKPATNYVISKVIAQPGFQNEQEEYLEPYSRNHIPADYSPFHEENHRPVKKFTVLNDVSPVQYGYVPETTKSFSHKFASSKTKDAFAMFR